MEQAGASKFKALQGIDEATIDDKGRLLIQKKKRERLGDDFVITWADLGCLAAYPAEVWDEIVAKVLSRDRLNHGTQAFSRLFFGYADDDLKFDSQGRVVIPQKMRELANLKDRVMVIGAGDRVEIWAKQEYEKYVKDPDGYGGERKRAVEEAWNRMMQG